MLQTRARLTRAERAERMREYIAGELARRGVLPTQRDVLNATGGGAALALDALSEFRQAQRTSCCDPVCREALRILIPMALLAAQGRQPQLSEGGRQSLEAAMRAIEEG